MRSHLKEGRKQEREGRMKKGWIKEGRERKKEERKGRRERMSKRRE